MFIRVKSSKNSPRKTVQIVENIRKGDTVTQKTVRYIGVANDEEELVLLKRLALQIKEKMENQGQVSLFSPDELEKIKKGSDKDEKLEKLNANDNNFIVELKKFKEEARVIDGIHDAYGSLYEQLSFNNLFGSRKKRSGEIFKEMVLARLALAKSKLSSTKMLRRNFGVRLNVEAVYRMMDQVDDKVIEKIKRITYDQTKKLFADELDVIFFDATTLYYESFMEDEFRKNGYSKDLKFNQPQVLLALMVTREGMPIGYEVFPGNTYEGHTVLQCLKKLKDKYSITRVVFVADSGMFNKETLLALDNAGFEYIVGARLKNQKKDITNQILDLDSYQKHNDKLQTKEINHKYGRISCKL